MIEKKWKYKILAEQDIHWKDPFEEKSILAINAIKRAKRTYMEGIVKSTEMLIKSNEVNSIGK